MLFFVLLPPFAIAMLLFLSGVLVVCSPDHGRKASDQISSEIRKTRQQLAKDAAERMKRKARQRQAPAEAPPAPEEPQDGPGPSRDPGSR